MTNVLFIGDVHGKWISYSNILETEMPEMSVQVGDMGVGFPGETPDHVAVLKNAMTNFGQNNRFIRGNHDNPQTCRDCDSWIPDATYEESTGIFYIGGAMSIDYQRRTAGYDWWENEELSFGEFYAAFDVYERAKPRVVVSHDCPESMAGQLMPWYKKDCNSRTRDALDTMWDIHRPDVWVFGHWHTDVTKTIDGCEFTCLAELSVKTINV